MSVWVQVQAFAFERPGLAGPIGAINGLDYPALLDWE
jgi:hypothetical protein